MPSAALVLSISLSSPRYSSCLAAAVPPCGSKSVPGSSKDPAIQEEVPLAVWHNAL